MLAAAIFTPSVWTSKDGTDEITRRRTFLDYVSEYESLDIDTEHEPGYVPDDIPAWVEANLRRAVARAGRSMGDLVWAEGDGGTIERAHWRAAGVRQVVLFMVVNDDC